MPKPATGHVRWVSGQAIARIRITADRRESFLMPTCHSEEEARERSRLLASVAKRLRTVQTDLDTKRKAIEIVATTPARSLHNALAVVQELVGGKLTPLTGAPTVPTFKEVCLRWTSGELARLYPDQVRSKRSSGDDESRLAHHVYPHIGNVPIDQLTLDQCEAVMQRLPPALAPLTRRHVAQLMRRALALAVYPLRLIERSPIPAGFLPSAGARKAFASLYPDEDRRLLGCSNIPLEYRMLWGFLAREGMRLGEAIAMTWGDLDLDRGGVRLDKNKSDDPRAWALGPDVVRALRLFRDKRTRPREKGDRVFVTPEGAEIAGKSLASLLREHLTTIGLHLERPELFSNTAERQQMRVHDLRGTFVTVNLANGKSESWISDRTGHRSSAMIVRYKRIARTFSEIGAGPLAPLDASVPELTDSGNDHTLTTTSDNYAESQEWSTEHCSVDRPCAENTVSSRVTPLGGHGRNRAAEKDTSACLPSSFP